LGVVRLNCKDCEYKKQIDAVEVMDGAPDWVCNKQLSDTEDLVCLLRMVVWTISDLDME
jgi:hypothetical protein